jgi:hypothetical protein
MDRSTDKVIAMLLKVLFRGRTRPQVFLRNSCRSSCCRVRGALISILFVDLKQLPAIKDIY